MSYKVRLPIFEGPFDLLVYLIENAQMSIYDIQVSEITSQYLDYISEMRQRNVNLYFLRTFYMNPYEGTGANSFYEELATRMRAFTAAAL